MKLKLNESDFVIIDCLTSFSLTVKYRSECIPTGAGRHYSQRKGMPQTHQDLGAMWSFDEDPQRSEEVSPHKTIAV